MWLSARPALWWFFDLADTAGFEPATKGLEGPYSIQLKYVSWWDGRSHPLPSSYARKYCGCVNAGRSSSVHGILLDLPSSSWLGHGGNCPAKNGVVVLLGSGVTQPPLERAQAGARCRLQCSER